MAVAVLSAHVPAWKKLGLELKRPVSDITSNTKEITTVASPVDGGVRIDSPLDTIVGATHTEKQASPHNRKRKRHDDIALVDDAAGGFKKSKDAVQPNQKKRAKSVSFSEGTKSVDGSSAGAVPPKDSKVVSKKVKSSKSTKVDTEPGWDLLNAHATSKSQKKRVKTKTESVPSYIDYLHTYANDRENWKFNKSKQTDLIKNLWNIYRVPPALDDVLKDYISGLQGQGARARIRGDAQKIIADDKRDILKGFEEFGLMTEQSELNTTAERGTARTSILNAWLEKQHRNTSDMKEDEIQKKYKNKQEEDNQRQKRFERAQLLQSILLPDEHQVLPQSTSPTKVDLADPKSTIDAVRSGRVKKRQSKFRAAFLESDSSDSSPTDDSSSSESVTDSSDASDSDSEDSSGRSISEASISSSSNDSTTDEGDSSDSPTSSSSSSADSDDSSAILRKIKKKAMEKKAPKKGKGKDKKKKKDKKGKKREKASSSEKKASKGLIEDSDQDELEEQLQEKIFPVDLDEDGYSDGSLKSRMLEDIYTIESRTRKRM